MEETRELRKRLQEAVATLRLVREKLESGAMEEAIAMIDAYEQATRTTIGDVEGRR